MQTIFHPTQAEIDMYVRRGRTLRSATVCAFLRRFAAKLAHRRAARPAVKWA